MKARTLIRLLSIGSWIGAVLVAVGFYIALFTDLTTKYGLIGLRYDVEVIALGLLLLVPARALLTLKLMKALPKDDEDEVKKD